MVSPKWNPLFPLHKIDGAKMPSPAYVPTTYMYHHIYSPNVPTKSAMDITLTYAMYAYIKLHKFGSTIPFTKHPKPQTQNLTKMAAKFLGAIYC